MENNDYISELHYSDDRDGRVQETAEFFTPSYLVQEMLNSLNVDWDNIPDETFIDPTCGSGNFLVELAKRGVHPKNIYGVDLMDDNVETCKNRLLDVFLSNGYTEEESRFHLDRNIVQGDVNKYHYEFHEHQSLDDEW